MTVKLLDFGQALRKADTAYGKKHLLLGNGFSIACKPDIFAHPAPKVDYFDAASAKVWG